MRCVYEGVVRVAVMMAVALPERGLAPDPA